jgi:hypothetical protein
MNGYANADTYLAATKILNIETLFLPARRMTNIFSLRNLFVDAMESGIVADRNIDIENVDFEEILDAVLDD